MMILVTGASGSGKSEYAESLAVKLAGKIGGQNIGNEIQDADCTTEFWDGYKSLESQKLYYLATMRVYGEEGMRRVERHRRLRAGKGFHTVECPVNVDETFARVCGEPDKKQKKESHICVVDVPDKREVRPVALLECMSNLVANEMFPEPQDKKKSSCAEKKSLAGQKQDDMEIRNEQRTQEKNACVRNIIRQIKNLSTQTAHLVIVTNQIFEDGIVYEPETMEYIRNLGQINQVLAEMADSVVEVVAGIPLMIKGKRM